MSDPESQPGRCQGGIQSIAGIVKAAGFPRIFLPIFPFIA